MAKKALKKDLRMEIRRNRGRYLSIFLIVALGVAFFSGLRASESDMRYTADGFVDTHDLMDVRVVSTMGLTDDDIEALSSLEGVEQVEASKMKHVLASFEDKDYVIELTAVPDKLNKIQVTEGRMPETTGECLADNRLKKVGYELGDTIETLPGTENALSGSLTETAFEIVGFGDSPLYLGMERGSATVGSGQVNGFAMVLPEVFDQEYYSQIFLTARGAKEEISFTDEYTQLAAALKEKVEELEETRCQARYDELRGMAQERLGAVWERFITLDMPQWYVTDRDDLPGYTDYGSNAERIGAIGKVFPAIFFLVAALVALTAVTRMVEEQRTQIGTYKALGYSKHDVIFKYLTYALSATLGGSIAGVLIGEKLFPFVIIISYRILYTPLIDVIIPYNLEYAVLSVLLAVVSIAAATFAACYRALSASPAVLMRPVAPKPGKRVLLERISILWNHLSFTQKATLRNLFRYKKRFVMTVFGIGCCCGLMVVGFGLKDSIMKIGSIQYDNIQLYDAMVSVEELDADAQATIEEKLSGEDGVKDFVRVMMKSMDASTDKAMRTAYVVVTDDPEALEEMMVFRSRKTQETYHLSDDGVILSEQLSGAMGAGEGDRFTLRFGDAEQASPKVQYVAENYLMHYIYMTQTEYENLFGEEPEYNMYWVDLDEQGKQREQELGSELMELEGVLTVSYVSATRDMIENMLNSLYIIVIVLVISASLLAFVVIYNLNNINISERRRELATIKLLGFYDLEVAGYVYRENVYLTLLGAAAGLGIGRLLHAFVINTIEVNQVMFGRQVSGMSYFWCVVLTIVFSAFVNFVMYFQLKKIDMVESLKSVE